MRKILENLVEDSTKVDLAVKVFFAILYNKLICPGSAVQIGREAAMLVIMNYTKMAKMDYCQLVVDEIKEMLLSTRIDQFRRLAPKGVVLSRQLCTWIVVTHQSIL